MKRTAVEVKNEIDSVNGRLTFLECKIRYTHTSKAVTDEMREFDVLVTLLSELNTEWLQILKELESSREDQLNAEAA
jgi:hypothetical protein